MSKYAEAEKRLAELLLPDQDWKIAEAGYVYSKVYMGKATWKTHIAPPWTSDWNACGPLMVEHDLDVARTQHIDGREVVYAAAPDEPDHQIVFIGEHATKEAATRYAIVMAVITKKESEL